MPDGGYALRVRVVKADGNYLDSDPRRVSRRKHRPVDTPTPEDPRHRCPNCRRPRRRRRNGRGRSAHSAGAGFVAVPTIAPTPTLSVTVSTVAGAGQDRSGRPEHERELWQLVRHIRSATESATSIANQLFSGSQLVDTAKKAATYTAAAFVLVGLFFGVKGILVWLWYKIKP